MCSKAVKNIDSFLGKKNSNNLHSSLGNSVDEHEEHEEDNSINPNLEKSNGDDDWLSIDSENDESSNDSIQNKGNKRRSAAWQYFEIVE
jgi:hypothetical protein